MVTAKVRAMVFSTWWIERVEYAPKAWTPLDDLMADYAREHAGAPMKRQAFATQLGLRKSPVQGRGKDAGVLGVRLKPQPLVTMAVAEHGGARAEATWAMTPASEGSAVFGVVYNSRSGEMVHAGEIKPGETHLNTPELHDFAKGVVSEAQHQRARWGAEHDAGKTDGDWFWLVGFLAGKALHAAGAGNIEKALHHTISTAAALGNWHAALSGASNTMRPGIDPARAKRAEAP